MSLPEGEAVVEFIKRWFEEKGVELFCEACGRSCWQPTQYTMTPWVAADGQLVGTQEAGPLFYQLLPLYCRHCGFIVFFNCGPMDNLPTYFPEQIPEAGSDDKPM